MAVHTNHLSEGSAGLPTTMRLVGWSARVFGRVFPRTVAFFLVRLFRTPLGRRAPREADLAGATQHRVRFGDGHLRVYRYGQGPAVLLVHGWRAHAGRFRVWVPALVARGYSVLTVDIPAHGHSDGARTDPFATAEALAQVVQKEGPLHAIVAHSFGAASVSAMLRHNPGLSVDRVVLLGCPDRMLSVMESFAQILAVRPNVFRAMVGWAERMAGHRIEGANVADWLNGQPRPGLVVHDLADEVVEYEAAPRIAASWGRADLVTTEGLGHDGLLYDETVIARVGVFLDEHAAARPAA